MIFLIVNAALSAILFLIVVLPPLYIYNPAIYPDEINTPPEAGEVIPDTDVTHAVKQKLYLLFIIPFCAAVNAIFLYFAYYRPIRFIHYRVELNLLTLRLTLDAGRQQLQKSGVLAVTNRSIATGNFSMVGASAHLISRSLASGAGRSFAFEGAENSRQKLATSVSWEWKRHARPKTVRKDVWVNSAVFAEISELRDEVEQRFLLEGGVVEANFVKAVVKTIGVFVPTTASPSTMVEQRAAATAPAPVTQKGFYNSSRPPLMALGGRAAMGGNAAGMNGNGGVASSGRRGVAGHDAIMPQRADSVLMVPMESTHRKAGNSGSGGHNNSSGSTSNGNSGGGGGGGASAGVSSALRFFKGGLHSNQNSATGNRLEQPSSGKGRRESYEPAAAVNLSPLEQPKQ